MRPRNKMATRRIMRDALQSIARLNTLPDELKIFAQARPDADAP